MSLLKASSYREAVCVSYIPVAPIATTNITQLPVYILAKCIRVTMSANKQLEHPSSSLFGELESLFKKKLTQPEDYCC